MNCESSSTLLCRRRLSPFTAAFAVTFLLLITGIYSTEGNGKGERNRIGSEKCSKSDIAISQSATGPLPNGIPTYRVGISNTCISAGCNISNIHIRCGWFSSARLVNPHLFKRLRFDDCLLNDGKPLLKGRTLSFKYANTFRYPLSVSSVTCSQTQLY